MWFDLEPTDLSFTECAPFKFDNEAVINASPARVFEILSLGEGERVWLKDFKSARWTSELPYGVGSTREVALKRMAIKERYVAWEPGRRLCFSVAAISLPVVTAMLQDLQIEPMAKGRTRLRWMVYYKPSLIMRLIHPVARAMFGEIFSSSTAALARYATRHPGDAKTAEAVAAA
jgi:hypothetical protein